MRNKNYIIIGAVIILGFIVFVQAQSNIVDLSSDLQDFFMQVARGNIQGHTAINKFGANSAVGTNFETIWDGGDLYYFPTFARRLNVSSSDVDDTSGGAGARSVLIQGLDENYTVVTEEIIMNGQSHVETTNGYLRVFRMLVNQSGATETNEGNIQIFNGTSTNGAADGASSVVAQITADNGQTLMSIYTIPAGKTGYMYSTYAASGGAKTVNFQLVFRPFGQSRNLKFNLDVKDFDVNHEWRTPLVIKEKTDIYTQAAVDSGSTRVSSGFDIILVDN